MFNQKDQQCATTACNRYSDLTKRVLELFELYVTRPWLMFCTTLIDVMLFVRFKDLYIVILYTCKRLQIFISYDSWSNVSRRFCVRSIYHCINYFPYQWLKMPLHPISSHFATSSFDRFCIHSYSIVFNKTLTDSYMLTKIVMPSGFRLH